MKRWSLILATLTFAAVLSAKETRLEITNAAPGIADTLPNNPAVPDVYAVEGQFDRILVLRFKYQADLLAGLKEMVREKRIRNAVILSGIGSVRGYHYHVVYNRTFPSHDLMVQDPESPADIAGMNGYVMDGRVHAHIVFANGEKAFGGHLEPGTRVFTFAIVTLGVMKDGADFRRLDDKTYR